MCVLAIAWMAHPRWRLVVAANRDEFHARAAAPLHRWADRALIAGRDLAAGGTWLAVSDAGRFAAVTNLRGFGDPDPARASRGALVADLALGTGRYAGEDAALLDELNPFHAIAVATDGAWHLSNRPSPVRQPLAPGLHAVSNGPLDPPWRKSVRLTEVIEEWLEGAEQDREALFAGLRDPSPPVGSADDPATIFIDHPVYGTRCSTLVLVDADGAGEIVERRFDPQGQATGATRIAFAWPA